MPKIDGNLGAKKYSLVITHVFGLMPQKSCDVFSWLFLSMHFYIQRIRKLMAAYRLGVIVFVSKGKAFFSVLHGDACILKTHERSTKMQLSKHAFS